MEKIYKILPRYAFIPIAASLVFNCLVYFGTRTFTGELYHYDISTMLDKQLPFVPQMIIIYVLAFAAWIIGYIVIGRESRDVCYEIMAAEQIAKILCLVCFIALPTIMVRPEVTGTGFCDWLTRFIYSTDSPDNLFPSIHCLESWMCFRGALKCKKVGNKYKVGMFIAAILVFASTLLVKQHLAWDVVGGVAVGEIGLILSRKFKVYRMYFALERKLEKNEK